MVILDFFKGGEDDDARPCSETDGHTEERSKD